MTRGQPHRPTTEEVAAVAILNILYALRAGLLDPAVPPLALVDRMLKYWDQQRTPFVDRMTAQTRKLMQDAQKELMRRENGDG